jgi:hypothetical protein
MKLFKTNLLTSLSNLQTQNTKCILQSTFGLLSQDNMKASLISNQKEYNLFYNFTTDRHINSINGIGSRKKIKKTCYSSRNQINNGSTVEFLFPERY